MKYLCLVHFEAASLAMLTPELGRQLTDDTIESDHALYAAGTLLLGQPLQGPETAVMVSRRTGALSRTDGPFAETKEWIGGIFLLEAPNLETAVAIAGQSPIARYSRIEVRPTLEQVHSVTGVSRPGI